MRITVQFEETLLGKISCNEITIFIGFLKRNLQNLKIPSIETRWLNEDALKMITLSGKVVGDTSNIEINTIHNPVLFKYYIIGSEFNQHIYE